MTLRGAVLRLVFVTFLTVAAKAAEQGLPERIDAAMSAGDFAAARPLAEEWLSLLLRQPEQKLQIARVQHVLGSIRDRLGDHTEALKMLEHAAAGYESAKAPAEDIAACSDEAGRAALAAGAFAVAERWLTKAIAGREAAMASISRSALAEVLLKTGRAEEARREWERALTEAGTDDSARCFALRGLGLHAHSTGAWDLAVKQFKFARDAAAAFGSEAPAMMAALDGEAGQALLRAGRAAEAAPLLESAAGWFQSHGGSPDDKAAAWNNLAAFWLDNGQSAKAAEQLGALLDAPGAAVFSASPQAMTPWLNLAAARQRNGDALAASTALKMAENLAAKHLPAVHPLRIQIALTAATIAADTRDRASAKRLAGEASQLSIRWMEQAAVWPDDSRLLEFHATLDAVSPLAALAADDPDRLASAVLATQGAVPEILLGRRRWESRAGAEAVQAWRRNPGQQGPPARKAPDVQELRAALPTDALMVNFVRWRPYREQGTWDTAGRYGALLISRRNPSRWVDLGPALPIENRLRRIIAAARDAVASGGESGSRTSIPWQLSNLHSLLWAPLGIIPDRSQRILLRADALLHFVPWGVLTDSAGNALCEAFPNIEIIVFPRQASAPVATHRWRVLASSRPPSDGLPDFAAPLPSLLSPSLLQGLSEMPKLPGVAAEVAAIRNANRGNITIETPEATESAFAAPDKSGEVPQVIHFAGHGFVCEDGEETGTALLRAGLVMSDCAAGLRDLAAGRPRPESADGLLFSADAAALPLAGVPAVILSGCQTGLGHWRPGGQLAGLRHAFLIAGAGTVASTLWDLNDAAAPEMVREVYTQLAAGIPPSAAVWQAQRAWLKSPAALKLTPGMRAVQAGAWTSESAGWRQ